MATFLEEKKSASSDDSIDNLADRLDNLLLNSSKTKTPISFEYYPPKTDAGLEHLYKVMKELKEYNGLFIDVTWGAGGSTSTLTLDICKKAKDEIGCIPNMHLTCTNMEINTIEAALDECKINGIKNILALRGDPPAGQTAWTAKEGGLTCAKELVEFIKKTHGDYFHISVAGYPEGHPVKMKLVKEEDVQLLTESEKARMSIDIDAETNVKTYYVCHDKDFEEELNYLKEKVDAGASCIITQMFFDTEVYGSFVTACRKKGITVPIVPGIMCIASYGGFKRMIKFCKTRVPDEILAEIDSLKDDEKGIKDFGIRFGVKMCNRLSELNAPLLHFYTLNFSTEVKAILKELDYLPTKSLVSN